MSEQHSGIVIGSSARAAALAVVTILVLGLGASAARASTTTINFETPVISGMTSPQAGPVVTNRYQSQGVLFVSPSSTPVSSPAGFSGTFGYPDLYRDTANAHSGKQVLYAYACAGEACSFGDGDGNMIAQLTTPTTKVELYAGAHGGASVEIAGYNIEGVEVAHQFETAGTNVNTHLQVTSSTADIAYFSVARIGYGALEIDDLSFAVPAVTPPPFVTLGPPAATAAYPGGSSSLVVDVQRFNGAKDAVDLTVSGLPSGVTLTSGTTIPAGSDSTILTFSVSSSAPLVHNAPFTVSATSADVSTAPSPLQEEFSVVSPGAPVSVQVDPPGSYIPASSATVPMAPCSVADVTVVVSSNPTITTPTSLALSYSGDTTGLSASLTSTSVGPTHGGFVFLNLIVTRTSSVGSGDGEIAITGANGGNPPGSARVVIQRTGLTAQGLYVTQGTQPDFGGVVPSGNGQSGRPYRGVSFVAGKTTVVRLYADAAGTPAGQPGVVATLSGFKNGHALPGSPLTPDYGPTTLPEIPGGAGRGEVVSDPELESDANAYTFTLPSSWVGGSLSDPSSNYPTATTLKLVGEVQPFQSAGQSASCLRSDSFTLNNVAFTEVGYNYDSLFAAVAMPAGGKQPPPPTQVFADANAVTPLPDGSLNIPTYFGSVDITDIANETNGPCGLPPSQGYNGTTAGNACGAQKNGDVLSRLEGYDDGAFNHVVGVTLGTAYGDTDGVPGSFSVVNGGGGRPLTSVSHEMFHQFGLLHASNECGGGQDSDNDDIGQTGEPWPPDQQGYLDGIGLDPTSEPYQFIAPGATRTLQGKTYVPTQVFDFMSYCSPTGGGDPTAWISPRNWTQLISNFGTGPAADIASAARAARKRAAAGSLLAPRAQVDPARLSVLGFVTSAGVVITHVGPQVGRALPRGSSVASFTLTAHGSHGQVLASVPMAATTGGHIDQFGPLVQITGELPTGGVDSIQVATGGKVMASRTRPARAPRVRVLAPRAGARVGARRTVLVRWKASNPEHLALTASIDYSRNGGRSWRTIFAGPNRGHVSLPSLFFTATPRARVRVRVNDGFNEKDAVSKRFTALGAPPHVMILTLLARRLRVPAQARLQVTGQAIDQAAQALTGRSLQWFNGPFLLGTGATISVGPLPAGVNHIRLVARDPAGRTASARLTVTVAAVNLPSLKLKIPERITRADRELKIRAGSSIPATLTIGRRHFHLGKSRHVSLPISPGRTPLLLHLKVTADGVTIRFAVRITRR